LKRAESFGRKMRRTKGNKPFQRQARVGRSGLWRRTKKGEKTHRGWYFVFPYLKKKKAFAMTFKKTGGGGSSGVRLVRS